MDSFRKTFFDNFNLHFSLIRRCRVRLLSVEMEGTFGRVYRGSYHEEGATTARDVLVKTAAEHASQPQVSFLPPQNSKDNKIKKNNNQHSN